MLDYNRRCTMADRINAVIDEAIAAERVAVAPRTYLGGSRLGHPCERALQFEFAGAPKDEGHEFSGQTLRIFEIGHALEDLAIRWLRVAGFDLYTRKGNRPDGEQFGFSVAGGRIRGHVDGIISAGPQPLGIVVPALWECKTMNAKNWRETVTKGVVVAKPVYAAQIALYQAYMEAQVPGTSDNPALFTAINKDTAELHHELVPFDAGLAQRMSDRAVRILQATDAGELLPRIAMTRDFHECRMCPWADRCWGLPA
ncbi:PD-(D/E)XK nuclease family protein [Thalassospira sp.]|uniref:PD-(D/E)XK nuclease family protein n=1 Tax=Thalassospira sp. TaxID=1912094 RepID=UPI001B1D1A83|nr:PD-(D/E)XK nuclease family protein [Thalassospira sp.]MBO6805899.1 PD-(D/E)XK nuclease family protein [Thalassospira sp.]